MTAVDRRPSIDFCDPAFYDDPWDTYRWLRTNAPLYRDETNDLWVVSRYGDVFDISRAPELYCSGNGVRPKLDVPLSLIGVDDPEHTRQRRMINRGFTPRRVAELAPHIRELSNQLIDEIAHRGEIDFVEDMAIHVPLIVIAELMGLDPQTRLRMYRWSDAMMAGDGHTDPDDPVLARAGEAFLEYNAMCAELIAAAPTRAVRRSHLGAHPEVRRGRAGSGHGDECRRRHGRRRAQPVPHRLAHRRERDDTRNAISGGLVALSLFPGECQTADRRISTTRPSWTSPSNELIRWVSPVISFSEPSRAITIPGRATPRGRPES